MTFQYATKTEETYMKTTIKRRPLGKTGEMISQAAFGAMNLRMLENVDEAMNLINHSLDLGINLIDTARGYNGTMQDGTAIESEVLVGNALAARDDLDEPIVVITKGHGYDPLEFDKDLAISRSKLGINGKGKLTIGKNEIKLVYFFHGITSERWHTMVTSGVLKHAKKLQEEGLFTYLGFSSHNGHEDCICEAIDSGYFEVIELPYSVFATGFGDDESPYGNIFKRIYDKGIGLINMKAFGGTGVVEKWNLFRDYCDISTEKRLHFCLANPYISGVDAGCRFISELDQNTAVSQLPKMENSECDKLVGMAQRVTKATANTCRECTHCLEKFECPQGLNFPQVLAFHTHYRIAKEFNSDIEGLRSDYMQLEENADTCVRCGLCNEWCEYKLDIPKLMDELKEVMG